MTVERRDEAPQTRDPILAELPVHRFWDAAPDGLLLVDGDGTIVASNREAQKMFGYVAEDLHGRIVEDLVPAESRERHPRLRGEFTRTESGRPMAAGVGLMAQRHDGSVFPAQISLSSFEVGDDVLTMAAVRDVTEWRAAEEQLEGERSQRERAEDRERIARDLHDTVIQELFGIGMGLQAVQSEADNELVRGRISDAVDEIDNTIRQVRRAIFGLQNPDPSYGNLKAALADVTRGLTTTLGFEPTVVVAGPLDSGLPPAVAEHLIPTVREALTNVAKHADATAATIEVDVSDELRVTVRDNGQGIPSDLRPHGGLVNLGRRAALLGGRFEVTGADGGGTELVWSVPID